MITPLPRASYRFRSDLLDRCTPLGRFYYIDDDTAVVVCPSCDGWLAVRFAGMAPRADLQCEDNCGEPEIMAALHAVAP